MSRIASDQVALSRDGVDRPKQSRLVLVPPSIVPHRLHGLAARLLARSNCIEDRPTHFRDGAFAEVGTTRWAVKP